MFKTKILCDKLSKLTSFSRTVDYDKFNNIFFRGNVNISSVMKISRIIETSNNYIKYTNQNSKKCEPIKLHITSYGGDAEAGILCYDLLRKSILPIHTYGEGYVCSAATLIFLSGRKRYMTEHTTMLIHQLRSGTYGSFRETNDYQYNCDMLMKHMKQIYLSNSYITTKELDNLLNKDIYIDSKQCLEYGFINKIL